MRTVKKKINDSTYELKSLTRGQVREISKITDQQDQADELIRQSIDGVIVDDIDMKDYKTLVEEIMSFNGLNEDAVDEAKKN